MKKIITLVICLTLVLCIAVPVLADENSCTLSARPITGSVGDVVTIPIVVQNTFAANTTAMDSMGLAVIYDSSILKCNGALTSSSGDYASDVFALDSQSLALENNAAGRYSFTYASAYGTKNSGILITLEFEITGEGDYSLSLGESTCSFYDTASKTQTSIDIQTSLAVINESGEEPAKNNDWIWIVAACAAIVAAVVIILVVLKKKKA
ncbi:MAG TPA: cohesin domain-containing protein [Eubacteriales bacterium]|nr:cohesin domain-containing protein [Clostridia bacterium]HRV72982.1 cohesin domain-containing protein [Eubacteriales bacterium]